MERQRQQAEQQQQQQKQQQGSEGEESGGGGEVIRDEVVERPTEGDRQLATEETAVAVERPTEGDRQLATEETAVAVEERTPLGCEVKALHSCVVVCNTTKIPQNYGSYIPLSVTT